MKQYCYHILYLPILHVCHFGTYRSGRQYESELWTITSTFDHILCKQGYLPCQQRYLSVQWGWSIFHHESILNPPPKGGTNRWKIDDGQTGQSLRLSNRIPTKGTTKGTTPTPATDDPSRISDFHRFPRFPMRASGASAGKSCSLTHKTRRPPSTCWASSKVGWKNCTYLTPPTRLIMINVVPLVHQWLLMFTQQVAWSWWEIQVGSCPGNAIRFQPTKMMWFF